MNFLHFLAAHRTPALDAFFLAVSEIGHGYILLALGAAVLWFGSPRIGYRAFFGTLAADTLGDVVKALARVPRPWILDPTLVPVPAAQAAATSYSFPSGHTTNFAAFLLILAASLPAPYRRRALPAAIVLALLMALSRMYLGVHTPWDVTGGFHLAAVIAFATVRLAPRIETSTRARAAGAMALLLAVAALWIAFAVLPPPEDNPQYAKSLYRDFCALLALLPAALLERRFVKHDPSALSPALRLPVLLLGLWGLLFAVNNLPPLLRPALGAALAGNLAAAANPIWIAFLFPLLLIPLRRTTTTRKEPRP